MKILIDIGHPAHVHIFRPFAQEMKKKGHEILFTYRKKEIELRLLKAASLPYVCIGNHQKNILRKIIGLFIFDIKLLIVSIKFKPDIYLSHGSMYAAHVAWIRGKPHISFEDTFNMEGILLYLPFTKIVLTGSYDHISLGNKEIQYHGYHELAYLHPNRYKANNRILKELGMRKEEKYILIRFVSWNASHDFRHKGISLVNKIRAVREFSKYAKVFISSESEIPLQLKKYSIQIQPQNMHDAIAFSSLIYGESATMTSEAAVLGVPAIFINDKKLSLMKDQEKKYGLVFNFTESISDQEKSIRKAIELLSNSDHYKWKKRRKKLLSDKIDVTAFLVWFVENYPRSSDIMRKNPEYQYRFK